MKKPARFLSILMVLLLAASLIASCGGQAATTTQTTTAATTVATTAQTTTAATTAQASSAAPADKPYTFHFISHKLPDDPASYGFALNRCMKEYNAEHPNFEFEYEIVEQMNVPGKISLLIASNDMPDAFTSEAGAAMQLIIDSGSICNMEDALKSLGYESYKYVVNDAAIEFITGINGKPFYYLPTNQTAEGIWYNKDMYKQYNLEVPKTWEQFVSNCEVLKKNGVQPLSAGGQTGWPLTRWLAVTSGRLLSPDSIRQASKKDGLTFRDERFIRAATIVQDLFKAGYFGEGFNSVDSGTAAQMYIQGKSCMTYYLTSTMINFMGNPEVNKIGIDAVGIFPVPYIDGGISAEESETLNCLGINQALSFSKAKFNQGTNNEFLKYLVDHYGIYLWELNMMSPYRQGIPTELSYGQKLAKSLLDSVKSSHLWWEGAMSTAVTDVATSNMQLLAEGSITPKEYMDQLADAVDAAIK